MRKFLLYQMDAVSSWHVERSFFIMPLSTFSGVLFWAAMCSTDTWAFLFTIMYIASHFTETMITVRQEDLSEFFLMFKCEYSDAHWAPTSEQSLFHRLHTYKVYLHCVLFGVYLSWTYQWRLSHNQNTHKASLLYEFADVLEAVIS